MICALNGGPLLPGDEAFRIKDFSVLRCQRCGLLWTQIARNFDPDLLYTQPYFQGGVSDGYFDYLGSEAFLTEEYRARLSLIRARLPVGRLLEIGCATGAFLQEAQGYYAVQGIDVSHFAVEAVRKKGLDVFCGHLETSDAVRPP
jgi:SAM-dependent methyltransferase